MVIDDGFLGCDTPTTSLTCVVLGGRGFVGRSLVLRLLKLGNWIVRIADSAHSLQLDPHERDSLLSQALFARRASYFHVDVRHKHQIINAVEGSSVVFYTDSTTSYPDNFYHCHMTIVQGAKNVISACQECKVKRLIYNSSAVVAFDGSHDICDGDESLPYPWKFNDMLSELRSQAEALVLFANDNDSLLTCALRPSNVFGPGDTQLVPFLLNNAKSGWTKFIIGSGENMSDFTYVENVAHAHICAEEALCSRMVYVAGKAFFITNLEPIKFWDFVSLILEGLFYQRPFIKLPARMVLYILLLVKWMHEKLGLRKRNYSVSAHYIVQLASCTRTFKCSAAQEHLKYSPIVPMEEGVALTLESFSHLANETSSMRYGGFNEQSKVDRLLGSGQVADILLWRDEKITFAYFLALILLFYWFFLCGRTLISSAAKLLLLVTIILFGHGFLPSNIFGFTVQKISFSSFEISETAIKDPIMTLAYLWNEGVRTIRLLAQGDDWNMFFKLAFSLYFLRIILPHSLSVLIGVVLVFAFTSFFIYEQYEEEIDGSVEVLFKGMKNLKEFMTRNLPVSLVKILHDIELLNQNEGPAMVKNRQ